MGSQCSGSSPAWEAKNARACVLAGVMFRRIAAAGVTGWVSGTQSACRSTRPPAESELCVAEARTSRNMFSILEEAALASSASRCSGPKRAPIEVASSVDARPCLRERADQMFEVRFRDVQD